MPGMSMDIPEGVIRDAIAVAIAEALSPERRDGIIRDVVRAHLSAKVSDYSKDTLLGKAVGDAVRAMTLDALMPVLGSLRPDVERIVTRSLGPAFAASVVAQVEAALKQVIVDSLSVNVTLGRSED